MQALGAPPPRVPPAFALCPPPRRRQSHLGWGAATQAGRHLSPQGSHGDHPGSSTAATPAARPPWGRRGSLSRGGHSRGGGGRKGGWDPLQEQAGGSAVSIPLRTPWGPCVEMGGKARGGGKGGSGGHKDPPLRPGAPRPLPRLLNPRPR